MVGLACRVFRSDAKTRRRMQAGGGSYQLRLTHVCFAIVVPAVSGPQVPREVAWIRLVCGGEEAGISACCRSATPVVAALGSRPCRWIPRKRPGDPAIDDAGRDRVDNRATMSLDRITDGGLTVGRDPAIKQTTRTGCINRCERIRLWAGSRDRCYCRRNAGSTASDTHWN